MSFQYFRRLVYKYRFKKFCREFLEVLNKASPSIQHTKYETGFLFNYLYYLCFEKNIKVEKYMSYQFFRPLFKRNFKKYFIEYDGKFISKVNTLLNNYTCMKKCNIVIIYADYFRKIILNSMF